MFETTNSRTHGSMYFVETTKIGDKSTFTVINKHVRCRGLYIQAHGVTHVLSGPDYDPLGPLG